jgi:DNA-binding beta-propeller fold protein YncE
MFLCGTLFGCASGTVAPRLPSAELLRWPAPPAESRVEWVREFATPKDLEIGKGFWKWLADLVTGEDDLSIVRPYGVFASEGRIYVADPGASVVHLYDTGAGRYSRLKGPEQSPLQTPIGITGDRAGSVYVTDSSSGIVFVHRGEMDTLTPFITSGLERPTGIACDRSTDRLYVTDTTRNQIAVFDLSGRELLRFGTRGGRSGEFNSPTDLCFDREGRLWVTDSLNFRLQVFSREGVFINAFGKAGDTIGYFSKPKGIAADRDGHIYSADALLDAIQIFSGQGQLLLAFGGRGTRPGEFWMPSGLFIDTNDTIYVADTYNKRIQVFQYRHRNDPGNRSYYPETLIRKVEAPR